MTVFRMKSWFHLISKLVHLSLNTMNWCWQKCLLRLSLIGNKDEWSQRQLPSLPFLFFSFLWFYQAIVVVADLERMSNVAGFTSPFMTLVLQVGKNNKPNRCAAVANGNGTNGDFHKASPQKKRIFWSGWWNFHTFWRWDTQTHW